MLRLMSTGVCRVIRIIRSQISRARRSMATRRLHGPRRVTLSATEVMVVLLARDAHYFARKFIDHHLALGAAHILVIDNGSADDTVEICRQFDRVTVLRNRLPAKIHESALRSELAQRVARGGWLLFVDADELVELPLSGQDALARLTGYCNARSYTAVLGQTLDRFSMGPYADLRGLDYEDSIRQMTYYSLERLDAVAYNDLGKLEFGWFLRDNRCDDAGVTFRLGGLRTEVFGEYPFLTKHSLVRNCAGLIPMSHPHCASGVSVADVTLLLHHYKLAGDWIARDRISVQQALWSHGDDLRRLSSIKEGMNADCRLNAAVPRQWRSIEALWDEGFLYVSPTFKGLDPA